MRYAILIAITGLIWAPQAFGNERVVRPSLPSPMPHIVVGKCPGLPEAAGCADGDAVYVPTASRSFYGRFALYHELGHVFDEQRVDAGERNRFVRLLYVGDMMPVPDMKWTWSYHDNEGRLIQSDNTPAEMFADAYALCRLGFDREPGSEWFSVHGYEPTARRHRQVCKMISRAGIDAGQLVAPNGDR